MNESLEHANDDLTGQPRERAATFARHLISLRGKSGRLEFFLVGLLGFVAVFMVSLGLNIIELLVGLQETTLTTIWVIIAFPIYLWLTFAVAIRRIHDLGHSGWSMLLFLVPFVNLLFSFYLLLSPGRLDPQSQ